MKNIKVLGKTGIFKHVLISVDFWHPSCLIIYFTIFNLFSLFFVKSSLLSSILLQTSFREGFLELTLTVPLRLNFIFMYLRKFKWMHCKHHIRSLTRNLFRAENFRILDIEINAFSTLLLIWRLTQSFVKIRDIVQTSTNQVLFV